MKFILIAGILLIFVTTFVFAQNSSPLNVTGGQILDVVKNSSVTVLQEPIVLPVWLQTLNDIVFGLEQATKGVPLGKFILLIILWIFLFIFSLEILKFTAFESKWVRIVIGLSVTLMVSMFGFLNNLAELLFGASGFILSWKGGLVLIVVVIAYFVLSAIFKEVHKQQNLINIKGKGLMAGVALGNLAKSSEAVAKEAEKDK